MGFGTAMRHGGAGILVWIGAGASEADLRKSWVLVHEMVHLGFPNVPYRQHWMEEGLATYVEEVARVRAGWISEEEFWGDLMRGFPKGLLQRGGQGLNASRRWGPLYWGGALVLVPGRRRDPRAHEQQERPGGCAGRSAGCRRH